ncbi:MAG: hypothetical protein GF418_10560 [Chitinivibrionales bacterium]|nr:hypothetical protein [Chitinivibrionales bacterium]MBD3396055.1 hypothetical protein [Chitinivibrionales bacterium]
MAKRVTLGLAGCGTRPEMILADMQTLGSQIELSAVFDTHAPSMEHYAEKFNPDARICTSFEDLIGGGELDWVMIATPNSFHVAHVCAALNAGIHVFSEKPLAISVDECLDILRTVRETSREFCIGYTLRYSPHYRKIGKLVAGGAIGDIISLEANETLDFNHGGHIHSGWRAFEENSGGHMLEKCSHDLDMINQFVGCRAARVVSFGGKNFFVQHNGHLFDDLSTGGRKAFRTFWRPHENRANPFLSGSTVVDNQVALIEYENGVRATFHTNCVAGLHERRMYILGTKGAIRADAVAGTIEMKKIGFGERIVDESANDVEAVHAGGDRVLAEEFSQVMLGRMKPTTTVEDGVVSAFTAFGMDESRKTGKIGDMAPYWEKLERETRRVRAH